MITVYTAVVDGFDNLRPPLCAPEPGVRFICFTNVPFLPRVEPWEFRPPHLVTRYLDRFSPSATSRLPKILPHLILPDETDCSIWHDGNMQLTRSPSEIVTELLGQHDWAAHRHPARDCVYEEAEVLKSEKIGSQTGISIELSRMCQQNHPEHFGLWANGFIVRRHTEKVKAVCESWWDAFRDGSGRDQISFPLVARAAGLDINTLPGNIYQSPYAKFSFHAPWKHRDDNPDFLPERARLYERTEKLKRLCGKGGYEFPEYS